MPKRILEATFEGFRFTRQTDRDYRSVLIGFDKRQPGAPEWKALSWASTPALANKASRRFPDYIYEMMVIDVKGVAK